MNVLSCSINKLIKKGLYEISDVEVGQHFYWQIGGIPSPCASPYYLLGCTCYLIRLRSSSGSQSTYHSNWRPKLL
ncbi:unnamed protein product [Brassica rapa]|uniref:Uncharacterized protein n=1 Tax=Brassica campestris TaxID=3711 RepID=A0A3P6AQN2_BRACM|nr:unnamed protein product [Brassica rapa]VDC96196.1 unnamed protein product [Brassica rapa]